MMRIAGRQTRARVAALATALVAAHMMTLSAQLVVVPSDTGALGRGHASERSGAYAEAARQYAVVLAGRASNDAALEGMLHVLPRLGRQADLDTLLHRAVTREPMNIGILGLAMQNFAVSGRADSAQSYALRWAALAPHDDEPFREWSEAASEGRDVDQARRALDLGRARLGGSALAVERAELMQRTGADSAAAIEWLAVVHATPQFREGAVGMLSQVPPAQRAAVRAVLTADRSADARRMLGLLLLQWGDPAGGVQLLRPAMPADTGDAAGLLRNGIAALLTHTDHASTLARANLTEMLAAQQAGAEPGHTMMEAAQAYADAGDESDARRVLASLGASDSSAAGMATGSSRTLVRVLIVENKPAQAAALLTKLGHSVSLDQHDALARQIAMVWARQGDFARALGLVTADSSIEGFDLRGRLRLYQGDLAGASAELTMAGPYAEDPTDALGRMSVLALLQAVGRDSSRALGAAMLTLARGDSARAVTQLTHAAPDFSGAGAAETRLLAGRVALAVHDTSAALDLFHQADVAESPATAAAARLGIAQVDVARGRVKVANDELAQLIIDFPASAVTAEARQLRETLPPPSPAAP